MEYYGQQNIICPFFVNENKNNIICQGLTDTTKSVNCFDAPTEKKKYKLNFCECFNYMDCPYYRILDQIKYQEENEMSKTLEEKLKGATEYIRQLQKEKRANERALKYQVDWREAEIRKQKAKVESTEMLTKFLVDKLSGGGELRVPIGELARYSKNYDVIAVVDRETNEVVCNLYDKNKQEFLDGNYNDYLKYINEMHDKAGKGNLFGDYIRIKEPKAYEKNKVIRQSMNVIREQAKTVNFPDKIKKKLVFSYKVFDEHKGSIIIAWFAVKEK